MLAALLSIIVGSQFNLDINNIVCDFYILDLLVHWFSMYSGNLHWSETYGYNNVRSVKISWFGFVIFSMYYDRYSTFPSPANSKTCYFRFNRKIFSWFIVMIQQLHLWLLKQTKFNNSTHVTLAIKFIQSLEWKFSYPERQ